MFEKFKKQAKEAYQQGKDKFEEKKKDYYDKKNLGWREEIILKEKNQLKPVQEWFLQYEKSGGKNKEESKSQQALQQKMNEVMVNKMTNNIMSIIVESLALSTEAASLEIQQAEPQIFLLLNSITGVFLTYRFQYKNKKKFQYLRSYCVDRIGQTFILFIDEEANKLGKNPEDIGPEVAEKIINKVVEILVQEIEKKKELTIQKFKNSSIFNLTGLENNDDIDEIIKMVIDIVQTYAEQKMNECIGGLRQELPKLFKIVVQQQQSIRSNMAYQAKYGENSQEYNDQVRDQMLNQIDNSYKILKDFIQTFLGRFFGIIQKNTGADKEDEQQQQQE